MKYTNEHGLPPALFQALTYSDYRKEGDYTASELVAPAQQAVLKQRHARDLEEDAADLLWRFLGSAVHRELSRADTHNAIKEERLSVTLPTGIVVSGQTDHYDGTEQAIEDYKTSSVWHYMAKDYADWEKQLNVYGWLWRKHGFKVDKLVVRCILRDWMSSSARDKKDYPKIPFASVELDLWSMEKAEEWVTERANAIEDNKTRLPSELTPCTEKEQWARPTTYRLFAPGKKRHVATYYNRKQVEDARAADGIDYQVTVIPGSKIRCETYCIVRDYCDQYAREHASKGAGDGCSAGDSIRDLPDIVREGEGVAA